MLLPTLSTDTRAEGKSVELMKFLSEVSLWVKENPEVVGLALVGSYARGAARPNSDVDLSLLCENANVLIDNQDWTARFGEIHKTLIEHYGPITSLRVFYKSGLEVEFSIADTSWARVPLDSGTRQVILDGLQILYDPKGILKKAKDVAANKSILEKLKTLL